MAFDIITEPWCTLRDGLPSFSYTIDHLDTARPEVKAGLKAELKYQGFDIDRNVGPGTLATNCHALSRWPQFQGYRDELVAMARLLIRERHWDSAWRSWTSTPRQDVQELRHSFEEICAVWWPIPVKEQHWVSGLWDPLVHVWSRVCRPHGQESEELLEKGKKTG